MTLLTLPAITASANTFRSHPPPDTQFADFDPSGRFHGRPAKRCRTPALLAAVHKKLPMVKIAYKSVLILFQGRDQEKTPFVGTIPTVGGLLLFSDD
jgi:hypothetical protein